MLARRTLNSIESKISKAFKNNEISHEALRIFLMKEKNIEG